ncbi:MAG: hypothetical protein ACRERD_21420 [Candidatus Binatia bacterium]
MSVGAVNMQDEYVSGLVGKTCARIRAKFPEATFEVCAHPTQRGAIIDAHVPTDDDFEVLDLVNPDLDDLLIAENIAISVRALGPQRGEGLSKNSLDE